MSNARAWGQRLVLFTVIGVTVLAGGTAARADDAQPIVELRLNGVVDPFVADYLRGAIADANTQDAPAILLNIDTPGGLASSMREITEAVLGSHVPVIGYVNPAGARAASAGAFVLMSCPVAAMAPGTNVGAATPVGVSGVVLQRKVTEDAIASIRSMAETYGRNPDVAESFVRDATSITAQQALDDGVIDLIEPNTDALLAAVSGMTVTLGDGSATTIPSLTAVPIEERSMAPGVAFLHSLFDPSLAFLFFWLGLILIVIEIIVPGHIFAGTIGTILLLIAFVSFGLLPVRLLGLVLLAASVVFFVLEIKAPGLGVWSIAGIVALVAGGLVLYDGSGGAHVSPLLLAIVAGVVALFFGVAVSRLLAIRHLPAQPVGAAALVGRDGVVVGAGLATTGVVRVGAEEWRARTAGAPLPGGTKVRVTALDGLVLTVEQLPDERLPASMPAEGGTTV